MFHANGWTFVWTVTAVGARHICLRKVEPARIFDLIAQEHVTILCAAPTVLIGIANAPDDFRTSPLTASLSAELRVSGIVRSGAEQAASCLHAILLSSGRVEKRLAHAAAQMARGDRGIRSGGWPTWSGHRQIRRRRRMAGTGRRASDADGFYDTTRMYHRYRIPGLRHFDQYQVVASLHQPPLPFPEGTSPEFSASQRDGGEWDDSERTRMVLAAAYYDYETLHSSLVRIGPVAGAEYEEYRARHEEPGQHLIVKLANVDVLNPLRVYRFKLYRWLGADPDVYLVSTRHRVADAFLRRFRAGRPQWTVQYPRIDLQRMTAEGEGIVLTGTFGDIQGRPNLRSTSLSGFRVNEDAAWLDASAIGQLKTTIVQHKLQGEDLSMMVTKRGSIMIYGVEEIPAQLALVTEAYEHIVKKYETTSSPATWPARTHVSERD